MSRLVIRTTVVFVALLAVIGLGALWFVEQESTKESLINTETATNEPVNNDDVVEPKPAPLVQLFDSAQAQLVVDGWAEQLPAGASASIVILSSEGEEIASINPDEVYFAASIYKLYVAYAGYQAVDVGEVAQDEIYFGTSTRLECLDLMIRESESPCAEKMWADLGKDTLTQQLVTYGIENTNMAAVTTSATDAAMLLVRIAQGTELSDKSQEKFLESLRTQVYRDALNKGFSDKVTVYNKVGFNGRQEYHDTAIIELSDGRQAILSVLTDGVGTVRIIELAESLEEIMLPTSTR